LVFENNGSSQGSVRGRVFLFGQRLQVAQSVVAFVSVSVMQHKARQQSPVSAFVSVSVQRGSAVTEISVFAAEKPSVVAA
jgi:hypothetical protein